MNATQVLNSMILLFQHNNWNKLNFARDKHNQPVCPRSPNAVSFCLGGAFMRICILNVVSPKVEREVWIALRKNISPHGIAYFNDMVLNDKEEVISFLTTVKESLSHA